MTKVSGERCDGIETYRYESYALSPLITITPPLN
jgi:hypothetical protein